jgi:hypothetical protein
MRQRKLDECLTGIAPSVSIFQESLRAFKPTPFVLKYSLRHTLGVITGAGTDVPFIGLSLFPATTRVWRIVKRLKVSGQLEADRRDVGASQMSDRMDKRHGANRIFATILQSD